MTLVHNMWPSVTRGELIGVVLFLYAALILAFGLRYYSLYRTDPDLFFVHSEIEKSHASRLTASLEWSLARVRKRIEALAELEGALASGSVDRIPTVLASGLRVDGRGYTGMLPDGKPDDGVWLEVSTSDGAVLVRLDRYVYQELTPDVALEMVREGLAERHRFEKRAEERRLSLRATSKGSLGRWDLIYFSGVTQTTVGYGDVLPNSTQIRKLVLLQILIGYALLVGLLNLVLTEGA
jgi:hypothetical protein